MPLCHGGNKYGDASSHSLADLQVPGCEGVADPELARLVVGYSPETEAWSGLGDPYHTEPDEFKEVMRKQDNP